MDIPLPIIVGIRPEHRAIEEFGSLLQDSP